MENVTLREYFRLEDKTEYESILKHLKPVNELAGGKINFNRLSYGDVKACIKLLNSGQTLQQLESLFCRAYFIIPYNFYNASVREYFAAQNNLIKQFFNLQQRESKLLQSISADAHLWEAAGGAQLDKFGNLMPLVQLGEIYGLWPYELEKKPYNEILTLLVLHKERAEIQSGFARLKMKQKT